MVAIAMRKIVTRSQSPTSIKRHRSDIEMITDSEESQRVSVTHENQPVIVTVFKDPISQNDRVLALVTLPSGAKDVQFNLSPDGRSAIVDYEWPKALYTMDDLFRRWIDKKELQIYHPKIIAVQSELEKFRDTVDQAPRGSIHISLPIEVQTATSTWSKTGIKRTDGVMMLLVELMAHQKAYTVKQTDTALTFDSD